METLSLNENDLGAIGTVAAVGAISLIGMAVGAVPRLGPGRAIVFGFKSLFRGANPVSLRKADVESIRNKLFYGLTGSDQFLVVRGLKGIGKTCAIATAIKHKCGVYQLIETVQPGTDGDVFIDRTPQN